MTKIPPRPDGKPQIIYRSANEEEHDVTIIVETLIQALMDKVSDDTIRAWTKDQAIQHLGINLRFKKP